MIKFCKHFINNLLTFKSIYYLNKENYDHIRFIHVILALWFLLFSIPLLRVIIFSSISIQKYNDIIIFVILIVMTHPKKKEIILNSEFITTQTSKMKNN